MTIEQAIIHAEEVADRCAVTDGNRQCEEEHRQLAALLRELQERRKAPEIVFCKDCRKHNVRVGYEVSFKTNWRDDACPLADWRGKAQGHEFDYQYCVYAERRTE